MLQSGEYIGWLAWPNELRNKIVAGVGVQLRRTLPHPVGEPGGEIAIAEGRHAIVINVFTEPDWRRRGLATFLMERLIDWARAERLDALCFTPQTRDAWFMSAWGLFRLTKCVSKTGSTFWKWGRVVRDSASSRAKTTLSVAQ
jgi:GNAT superfamily N-acetyltransferase